MVFLLAAWGIYFFLHSFMANEAVKQRLANGLGLSKRGYRIAYNLFNLIALAFLLLLLYQTPFSLLYSKGSVVTIAGALVSLAGSAIMVFSMKNYDLNAFLGFREETRMPLQVKGLNKYVRHPLYSGTILLALGFCIALPYTKNWLLLLLMIVYIFIGMYYEEKKLQHYFGDEYKVYQQKVKQLIPHLL